jgi:hypothetical protein
MPRADELVRHRSELLARVTLTRRLNIDVFPLDEGGKTGIDFLCTIRDEDVPGFLPFGAVVWGTSATLETAEDAEKYGRAERKKLDERARYFIPVIVLLFSMRNDEGFFSWLVEPSQDSCQLVNVKELDFKKFDMKQFERMMKRITHWYKRLGEVVISDAAHQPLAGSG